MMELLPVEFIENFHFLRPLLLLGIIPAFLLLLLLRFCHRQRSTWNKAIAPELLPFLLDKAGPPKQYFPLYGLFIVWLLSFIALAGPVWQQIPVPVQEREDAMVIVLDMSLSMYSNDLSPNRLVRAQRKLIDVLATREDEGQTALVVYAGDAHAVTPLTDDVGTILNMVDSLEPNIMPVFGSNPALGISLALELLENANLFEAQLLLITDGINSSDISVLEDMLSGTLFSLSILGVGTEQGAPIPMAEGGFLRDQQNAIVIPRLQRSILQNLASTVNGRYTDVQLTDVDIDYLLDQSIFDENENLIESEREFDSWSEAGPWLLVLLLPFAAFAFRRGWLLSICLLAVMVPEKPAYAWEWNQLWNNKNQRANQTFINEDYQEAAQLFDDTAWRAAANYKSGSFEQALADLSTQNDIDSLYNSGNTLARLNRLEEAIAAYEQVLNIEADHADALKNKAIVEALLEQQQQEEQEQQNNSGENQDQEQQDGDQEQEGDQQQNQEQQDSSDQEQSGDQQDQQQDQEGEGEEGSEESDDSENQDESDPQTAQGEQPDSEEEQAMQQWLRRIEDNPGELLRNKFRYQSQQRLYQQLQNPNLVELESEQQIW